MGDGAAMSALEALTTTRAVRRRLDFGRPLPEGALAECLRVALQAPTGAGAERWRWVVVEDAEQRRAVGDVYRDASLERFRRTVAEAGDARTRRIYETAIYLAENIHRAPALVVPCIEGRVDDSGNDRAAGFYGSVMPAVWSLQVALRARGLGSCWTSVHLKREREMAAVLGIPVDVTQVALLPVARVLGEGFRPARRKPLAEVAFVNRWGDPLPESSQEVE
jgi:nitroreductase